MTLQHQEVQEPDTSEVIRLAQQMYERDRLETERRSSLAAAAEEMGIPAEYLAKAAAQLKTRQVTVPTQRLSRSKTATIVALALGVLMAVLMSFLLTTVRAVSPPQVAIPATIDISPPREVPVQPAPLPAPNPIPNGQSTPVIGGS